MSAPAGDGRGTRVIFRGGETGAWRVTRIEAAAGSSLEAVSHVAIAAHDLSPVPLDRWRLRGTLSHARYVTRVEREHLLAVQPELNRPEATRAALIPIRKSAAWWDLAQDERRAIFEERSRHIATGMKYLPAIARRLYHGRELGEPFDFLTWFEYAPRDEVAFEALVSELRRTEEWRYVEREIDIRLTRSAAR